MSELEKQRQILLDYQEQTNNWEANLVSFCLMLELDYSKTTEEILNMPYRRFMLFNREINKRINELNKVKTHGIRR